MKIIKRDQYVFSHNDLWTENCLVTHNTKDVKIIDFETVDYNFRGYDLGRIMLETVYLKPKHNSADYEVHEETFPSQDDFLDWARYYLIASKFDLSKEEKEDLIKDDQKLADYEARLFSSEQEYIESLDNILKEIRCGLLLVTYWNSMFAIKLARDNPHYDFFTWAKDSFRFHTRFRQFITNENNNLIF